MISIVLFIPVLRVSRYLRKAEWFARLTQLVGPDWGHLLTASSFALFACSSALLVTLVLQNILNGCYANIII